MLYSFKQCTVLCFFFLQKVGCHYPNVPVLVVACVPTSAAGVRPVGLLGVSLTALCLVSPWHSNIEVVACRRSRDNIQWLHYEIMSVIPQKCNLLLKMSISAVCINCQCDPLCYCFATPTRGQLMKSIHCIGFV